jgi:poly(3-hydroxybutyrate) depolymerase
VPTPLVFDIHGYSGSAQEQYERTRLDEVADAEGFIMVYPDGLDDTFGAGQVAPHPPTHPPARPPASQPARPPALPPARPPARPPAS